MSNKVLVTVKEGKVCGIKSKSSFSGVEFYSFYGIPYGQSTAKHARFRDPVKVKPWKNIYDATVQKEGCLQFSLHLRRIAGDEDCLYNNIYTPKLPSEGDLLKPVVVCIHPGGLSHGSPEPWHYGSPDYVMHQDIVYVCVAFRLHIFGKFVKYLSNSKKQEHKSHKIMENLQCILEHLGFLNLGIEECSGNQGIKDIILSLKWINENISVFGGDPGNITLLGSSSGSLIVNYLMLSPATKGLYHKVVMMGPYVFEPTRLFSDNDHLMLVYKAACCMGYSGNDPKDKKRLLNFLRKLKIEQFVQVRLDKADINMNQVSIFPISPFIPTIDSGPNAVLPAPFTELLKTMPRVPLIYGICDKEAAMAFTTPVKKITMNNFYTAYLQSQWSWARGISEKEVEIISERIRAFYLNGKGIETASINVLIDILTDMTFSEVYETVIDLVSAELPSSVFVYKFEFEGNVCSMKDMLTKNQLLMEDLKGTFHAEDYSYWAYIKDHGGIKNDALNVKSAEMVETFTKLITTFARKGDPNFDGLNVVWEPSTPEKHGYLSINDPLRFVDGKLNGERMRFWEDLKKEFKKI